MNQGIPKWPTYFYPHLHGQRVQYLVCVRVCVCVCLSVCLSVYLAVCLCVTTKLTQNLNKLQVTNLVI